MHVAGQEYPLADQKQQGHAQAAEDFEIYPELLIGEGHIQIGCTAEQEEEDPGDVQSGPDRLGQSQCMAHDALDQWAVTDEVTACECQGEQPVDHWRLPFKNGFAMESQGQAAEHQAGDQGQPLAFFQFALGDEQNTVDHERADDQHRGSAENSAYHEAVVQNVDGAGFDLVDDEKQEQRDEVDELFHNGSQKQDVAA
mgnify:FL=1